MTRKNQEFTVFINPFQMIGGSNLSITGYSFCSGARICTENHYSIEIKYYNQTSKMLAPVGVNGDEACIIHGKHPTRLFAKARRTLQILQCRPPNREEDVTDQRTSHNLSGYEDRLSRH